MNLYSTGISCAPCGEGVQYAEETVVITIEMAQLGERGMTYAPLVVDPGVDHEFLWEPTWMCPDCCGGTIEQLHSIVRDMPILEDPHTIITCNACACGIHQNEVVGKLTRGEVHRSPRNPNCKDGGSTFVAMDDDPIILCIGCINKLSSDVVDELWQDPIQQHQECPSGTDARCWRRGCPADATNGCGGC